jgi:hypothetical protein
MRSKISIAINRVTHGEDQYRIALAELSALALAVMCEDPAGDIVDKVQNLRRSLIKMAQHMSEAQEALADAYRAAGQQSEGSE